MSLFIHLASVRPQVGQAVPFQMEVEQLPLLGSAWTVKEPIVVRGFFYPEAHEMVMQGTLRGRLLGACSRCLAPLDVPLDVSFEERLLYALDIPHVTSAETDADDLEETYWIYDELDYDFEALVTEQVVSALPVQPLCDAACKGLCSNCGQNLNKESCTCDTSEIDPRWAKLAQLKNGEVE